MVTLSKPLDTRSEQKRKRERKEKKENKKEKSKRKTHNEKSLQRLSDTSFLSVVLAWHGLKSNEKEVQERKGNKVKR